MQFKGDVVICDPCYILQRRDHSSAPEINDFIPNIDFYKDRSPRELKELGFHDKLNAFREAYNKWSLEHPTDWVVCGHGDNLSALGFTNFLTFRSFSYNLYTVKSLDTNQILGHFNDISGVVGIFLVEELLKYNPEFVLPENESVVFIKDFDGNIEICECPNKGMYVKGTGNINFQSYIRKD